LSIGCVKVPIEIFAVHLLVQICDFVVQKNIVVGELRATLLPCSILQTDSTDRNNMKQEKEYIVIFYMLHLPLLLTDLKGLNMSGV
jgi:hypothetical protein